MVNSQSKPEGIIYLFPGQGSDERIFSKLKFPEGYGIKHIVYPVPNRNQSLPDFAAPFVFQIDTGKPIILVGYSLGGMICTELAALVNPELVILISSAKVRSELPGRYRFMQWLPIYRIIPAAMVKAGALLLQPIVEPDRKNAREIFKSMLWAKDKDYLKRTSQMIITWNRTKIPKKIVHIHGSNDHTIPINNVTCDYIVENGSHMMILTQADTINPIISGIIRDFFTTH